MSKRNRIKNGERRQRAIYPDERPCRRSDGALVRRVYGHKDRSKWKAGPTKDSKGLPNDRRRW